jgi:CRISPR-associated protein Cas4
MSSDPIPISALQHYLYCPRQCALIHLEQAWAENRFTAEGRVLHERADSVRTERRRGVRTVSAMPVANNELGIVGVADMVEFHETDDEERAYPVEYKRGRPKSHQADEVQLCAQALCLESMFDYTIPEGALFYGKTRRRKAVSFDDALRVLTRETICSVQELFATGKTPLPQYDARRCSACSLMDICQPALLEKPKPVNTWLRRQLSEEDSYAPPT